MSDTIREKYKIFRRKKKQQYFIIKFFGYTSITIEANLLIIVTLRVTFNGTFSR